MRAREWDPIAKRYLINANSILHSDGARAYRKGCPGLLQDEVVHKKKLVKKGLEEDVVEAILRKAR